MTRIGCCIAGCRSWMRADTFAKRHGRKPGPFDELICWRHWRMIPLRRRQAYRKAFERPSLCGGRAEHRLWEWCKHYILKVDAGIA